METSTVHIWRAVSDFSYTPEIQDDPATGGIDESAPDVLDIVSFLERDGSVVTGIVLLEVKIYDGSTLKYTLTADTNIQADDDKFTASGTVVQQWTPTTLVSGKVYSVVTEATIGTGGVFKSPTSYSITAIQKLQDLEDFVASKLDTPLSQVKTDVVAAVNAQLAIQTQSLEEKLDAQSLAIDTALSDFTISVAASIVSLETAAADSLTSAGILGDAAELSKEAALNLQEIGRRQAAKLLIPASVKTGEPVQLRYRGWTTGLIPLIDVLDGNNKAVFQAIPMTELLPDNPSIYEFVIDRIDSKIYAPGSLFTVIVTESSSGSIESGAVFVEKATGLLLMPGTVVLGDKLNIRFSGRPDWIPKITIIDFENEFIVEEVKMTIVKNETDIFEYTIDEITADIYPPGKPITVTVKEKITAATETGTILIESTSLSSLEGLVAAGSGQKSIIKDTLDAINAVKGNLTTGGDISMALEEIRIRMKNLPKELAGEQITVPIISAVDEMREQFMNFAGEEGYNFQTLLETGLEESATIADIRDTTDRVQGATEVMQKIFEQKLGGEDAPIVHSFFH